ncbi:VWA domain-containing protein [Ruficoccus amylovorans]|uniref:VWA domain-containing protein n=1 Tax=Ruficoccus amylovorans TaxID=1804625 RepID=A0A842HBW5_9BACT|nr:BatA and WFA domain-containing protein [Ruficoccus amylovorans]MBC2593945.1 VWA domain-containing protein [Ruficoccus amylovorans]
MQFLNPGIFGLLLPLVAVPLLIHLLSRRARRTVPFSSLELLRQSSAQQSRLHRWRHLLLLLVRTAFVLLLLGAFLRPVWLKYGPAVQTDAARNVVLVFDRSLSMEAQSGGNTARSRAVLEAEKIIASLDSGDTVNLVLAGADADTAFLSQSQNHAEARRALNALGPGYGEADFGRANLAVTRTLEGITGAEIYYLSDFQRTNWAKVDFRPLPVSARTYFVNVGEPSIPNRAILKAGFDQSNLREGDLATLKATVGNFSEQPFEGRLTFRLDDQASFEQETTLAPWSTAEVSLPLAISGEGEHRLTVELPDDALEADNFYFLTVPVSRQEEVLVASQSGDATAGGPYFVRTAVNPFRGEAGSFAPRVIPTAQLDAVALSATAKLILTDSGPLTEAQAAALADFVFSGGALIWFLDGPAEAENARAVDKAMGGGKFPLLLGPRREADALNTGTQQIIRGEFRSPFLRLFRGSARQNLALLEIYDYYQASRSGEGKVLLSFADETPAMAEFGHGLGTGIVFNFSPDALSSNFARQRIFPAWLQDILRQLDQGEGPPPASRVDTTLTAEVWPVDLQQGELKDPQGERVSFRREALGGRIAIAWETPRSGFYQLKLADGSKRYFAVNVSSDESDLRLVEPSTLPAFEQKPTVEVQGQAGLREVASGVPLFQYFLLGALALAVLERLIQFLLIRKVRS